MHHLGVATTRAISLVVSREEATQRPVPEETAGRRMQTEPCAITCRVAPSFLRIGHFELFGRRVARDRDISDAASQAILSKFTVSRPRTGSEAVYDFSQLSSASVKDLKAVIQKAGLPIGGEKR